MRKQSVWLCVGCLVAWLVIGFASREPTAAVCFTVWAATLLLLINQDERKPHG